MVAIFLCLNGELGVEFLWPLRLDDKHANVLESAEGLQAAPPSARRGREM
jgi:hypothetical protein